MPERDDVGIVPYGAAAGMAETVRRAGTETRPYDAAIGGIDSVGVGVLDRPRADDIRPYDSSPRLLHSSFSQKPGRMERLATFSGRWQRV